MAYRVQAEWTGLPGTPGLSTFYLDQTELPTAAAAVSLVAAFLEDCGISQVGAYRWTTLPEVAIMPSPDTVTDYVPAPVSTGTGNSTGEPGPRASQLLIRWRTSVLNGNRRVLGKFFLPGLVETTPTSTGGVSAATQATYSTIAQTFANGGLLVASRKLNVFAPVTSADVWSEFAVLRSRRD